MATYACAGSKASHKFLYLHYLFIRNYIQLFLYTLGFASDLVVVRSKRNGSAPLSPLEMRKFYISIGSSKVYVYVMCECPRREATATKKHQSNDGKSRPDVLKGSDNNTTIRIGNGIK